MKKQLLVREVDETLVKALKQRAAINGRSTEAEHRLILEKALRGPKKITLAEALTKIPPYGEDGDFHRRDESGNKDVFD
jgi:plasmid stability protein